MPSDSELVQRRVDRFFEYQPKIERPLPRVETPADDTLPGAEARLRSDMADDVLDSIKEAAGSWLLNNDLLQKVEDAQDQILSDLNVAVDSSIFPLTAEAARRLGSLNSNITKDTLDKAWNILKNGASIIGGVHPLDLIDAEESELGLIVPMSNYHDRLLNKGEQGNPCDQLAAPDATVAARTSDGNVLTAPLESIQERTESSGKAETIASAFKVLLDPWVKWFERIVLAPLSVTPIGIVIKAIRRKMRRAGAKSEKDRKARPSETDISAVDRGIPMRVQGAWRESAPKLSTKVYFDGESDIVGGTLSLSDEEKDRYTTMYEALESTNTAPTGDPITGTVGPVGESAPYLVRSMDDTDPFDKSPAACYDAAVRVVSATDRWARNKARTGGHLDKLANAILRRPQIEQIKAIHESVGYEIAAGAPEGETLSEEVVMTLEQQSITWSRNGVKEIRDIGRTSTTRLLKEAKGETVAI